MNPLPSEFTSLYRLFLRATSATVLHQGRATRSLRRLYRPSFEAAAAATRDLAILGRNYRETRNVRIWLAEFDKRINNTLVLLHNSSLSRGLPHRVVSNLSLLERSNYSWSMNRYLNPSSIWNPQLPPDSPEYTIARSLRESKRLAKIAPELQLNDKLWGALGEVVRMAEGRDGLLLGRARFDKKRRRL